MFKTLLNKTSLIRNHLIVNFTSSTREKWDIFSSVCVERKPIITPELNNLEKDYYELTKEIEFEKSLKSDFELRHEKECKQMEKLKAGDDVDVHLKETVQDLLDTYTDELSKFQFASRITKADNNNDIKSLNRKLDKHLVLVMKQKVGNNELFLLPQSLRLNDESLRQTAERTLNEFCGANFKTQFYGNAPCGFYKYRYPNKVRQFYNGSVGAKIFFYFVRHKSGLPLNNVEFKWLSRSELKLDFPLDYHNQVVQFLIDE